MDLKIGLAAAAAALAMGAAPAPQPPAAPMAQPPAAPARTPYLGDAAPDSYRILPPSPAAGTPRDEADRQLFRQTRALQSTARWKLAQNDVDQFAILKDLSCAVGVELTPKNAPATAEMIARVGLDVATATNRPKDIYKRPRPYLRDDGQTCIEKTDLLSKSPDYPSGHNAWGWTVCAPRS